MTKLHYKIHTKNVLKSNLLEAANALDSENSSSLDFNIKKDIKIFKKFIKRILFVK